MPQLLKSRVFFVCEDLVAFIIREGLKAFLEDQLRGLLVPCLVHKRAESSQRVDVIENASLIAE